MASQGLSFKVLDLLGRERGIYGMRNGEYERYYKHCSNKLHRLRQVTGLTNGKGKTFKKAAPVSADSAKGVGHLQLLLFTAERALAHSHQLKALSSKGKQPASVRREQISWLRRALKAAASLRDVAQALSSSGQVNQKTYAEISIYYLSIRAELAFEREAYADVLADLAARRKLLATLGAAPRDSYDMALATEFADAYDPLIRFSAYKLGRSESHDIDGVVSDIDDDMMEEALPGFSTLNDKLRTETNVAELEAGRRTLEDVHFAGEKVEFRNAELVAAMIKVQEALGRLSAKTAKQQDHGRGRGGMKGWDRVLGVLGEAEATARRLLDQHDAGADASQRSTRTAQSLTLAHQYIVYLLLSHRIRRDLLLVETLQSAPSPLPSDPAQFTIQGGRSKLEEAIKGLAALVKLYDTVLQSLSQLRSLAIVEEKEGVRHAADGAEAFFQATRCYHLARAHCIHPTPSYGSAVQLLQRASDQVEQAQHTLFGDVALQEDIANVSADDVASAKGKIATLDLAAKRALFAHSVSKPIFYDTAFNYVDLPMEDLLDLAGKGLPKSEPALPAPQAVPAAKIAIREKTREATPQPEAQEEEAAESAQNKKGWLGGWFGRS